VGELDVPYVDMKGPRRLEGVPASLAAMLRSLDSLRRDIANDAGLSATEVRAMARIAEGDGITPKQLVEMLESTSATVTFVTTALAEKGLVQRVPHPQDRRSLLLRTTPTGEEVADRMYNHFSSAISRAVASVEGVEQEALRVALIQMAGSLGEHGTATD
jgi:DNA-binding MarR family transcriptional regulator